MANRFGTCSHTAALLAALAAPVVAAWPLQAQVGDGGRAEKRAADAPKPGQAPAGAVSPQLGAPSGSFEVVEWVVFTVDPNRPNASEATAFKSTLPGFARGRRPVAATSAGAANESPPGAGATGGASAATAAAPSPVGVIRLKAGGPGAGAAAGAGAGNDSVDVLIQAPSGRFLTHWPQGKARSNRVLWERVSMKPGVQQPVQAEAGHWFETLRGGADAAAAGTTLSTARWTERFLMYDAEFTYPSVLRLRAAATGGGGAAGGKGGAYQIANAGASVLRDVQVYAPAEGGWRVASLDQLAASKPAPAAATTKPGTGHPTTAPATGPSAEALKQVFSEPAGTGGAAQAGDAPAANAARPTAAAEAPSAPVAATTRAAVTATTTNPSTSPATGPATTQGATTNQAPAGDVPKDAWRELKVPGDAKPLPAGDAVAAWRPRLTDAGLAPVDVDVILAILRAHALDAEQLTVVYRIDPAELDRMLPLEVVPMPTRSTRVGIAIVKNVDPAAGERIAKLIEQLADASWDKREAAHAKLAELGTGARPKLTEALKHKDVEVVYRAERLLEALSTPAALVAQ